MKSFVTLLASFIVLVFSTTSHAQITTSLVSGKVSDPGGQAIPGVTVVVVNKSTGAKSGVQTNADGRYLLPNLNPGGPYTITVSFIGYKKEVKEDVNLALGTTSFNFKLQEESTALSEVVITGSTGGGKAGGTRVGQDQIKSLPTLSRSLQDLTRVTPQSNNNSFLGTNYRYNNVTLDGAINNDAIGFSPSLGGQSNTSGQPGSSTRSNPVSLDAIQDIQVLLAPFDVKVGNFLGGSINAVTRSGTNEFHGSIYGYGRNAGMIGKNKIGDGSKLPSDFHDYQTGVRLGFPIIKDKLFFFTNEEITRRVDPVILAAGSADGGGILTQEDADKITAKMKEYGVDAGTAGNTSIYSNSTKFFNRIDWHINDKHQLSVRNNTILSEATNLERDQQNFRFKGIDFKQVNNQTSTVAELKSNFSNTLSNTLILGYSSVHDYRDPLSDPSVPQIQIKGKTPGSTIFLGTDREASIFNMKQKTFEITDNVTLFKGNHTITLGTHNEFYNITYGFVNSWNGRLDYNSVEAFLKNEPLRVRGNFNYANNSRDNIMANPPAQFKANLLSVYAQDEIQLTDRFKITPGIRIDYTGLPNRQPLSDKTTNAPVDKNYGNTYTYTLPKDITNNYLNNVQISPRLGFNYDIKGDNSLVLRGGTGLFTGRIPFAWLGYAYYNNGVTYGAYDQKAGDKPFVNGPNPAAKPSPNGIADFAKQNGVDVNNPQAPTQVDLIDNNFKMPQVWRSSLAVDYTTRDQWKFTLEGIYTKVIKDLKFQQVNLVDNPTYYAYDVHQQQPIYSGKKINSAYTNAYLLSNTDQGYRYSITAQVNKTFKFGLNFMVAYTYGQSKDLTNGIRNSMESNWQLNQALNPNSPTLAYSNFDIRNRIVSTVNYKQDWGTKGKWITNFALFFNASSGTPFTYGFVNATVQGTPQQVSLAYIPKDVTEAAKFFAATATQTAEQQAAAFMSYVEDDKYLRGRKGDFTERNGGRTPWNVQADFRFSQDFNFKAGKQIHTLTLTYDIINLTNLLNKEWGVQYFSPNTFNSTASVGLTAAGKPVNGYPTYTFTNPGTPYSKDFFASRSQMQLGLRYSF
ncbi:TonB-dependent receptor [Chitinophaga nivalis]|uniref:Carboxypeptidase regulatory-like domain-containing protein n=1 Tax=Chitinophaga nivalis TaxID=2991709 RepID=A0ABT3IU64_9BACT|nr:carboxypeptidase regulatory-like domain-containing protein [Chitinophaga nivalis]MCW3462768.1 carboxypeptidase regulatory-like domain-containing protein [Chitinophaga nivalis]MCW3487542.1 carboxypeptidase regulatory-like domain-containing protein [Chitinophaga nivalis]